MTTPTWVGAGPTCYSDYVLATPLGPSFPANMQAGDLLFLFYAGRAGTPLFKLSPGWTAMPMIGGPLTVFMAWHMYAAGELPPNVVATAAHMTWASLLAYRGVGFDPKTGLPYEQFSMLNEHSVSSPYPPVTPQGVNRLVIKLGVAWVHDLSNAPAAQVSFYNSFVKRGPLTQQWSLNEGHQLLRFSDAADLPGTAGTTYSGGRVTTQNSTIASHISTIAFALIPAS